VDIRQFQFRMSRYQSSVGLGRPNEVAPHPCP